MQKFGIEIRKANTTNIYKDVDHVLNNHGIKSHGVTDMAKIQTVAHSLNKMIKSQSYFDVCTINNCAKMCQICISEERNNVYSSIHCMHWNEMLPEYREMIVAMVLDDFRTVLHPN